MHAFHNPLLIPPRIFRPVKMIPGLLLIIFIGSCSTQKNTWMSRHYHALTSHYNIYFNGNESFKQGVNKIQKNYKYDFTRILPVLAYDDDNLAKTVTSDMDRASKKASKIIALHSIKAKPEMKRGTVTEKDKQFYNKNEYNPWVHKAYLLIGKSHFYQHNYKLALETFRYMVNQYSNEEIRLDAFVWMARVYIETGEMSEAKKLLDALINESGFPPRLQTDLQATLAHYYIRREDYPDAIAPLEKALKTVKSKNERIRWTFILAQIYSLTNEPEKANKYFAKVIKMNPPYEVTFNARINMASNVSEGTNSAENIRKQLLKLAADQKNKEYLDQIYYALGKLSLRQKNTDEAISFFAKSAQASIGNTRQKALSYLTIADLYFTRPDYVSAAQYYDSAAPLVDKKNFKNYDQIMLRASNLTRLARDIQTVQLEDSLQKLSYMDQNDLNDLIDRMIEQVIKKETEEHQKQAEQMLADQINAGYGQTNVLQDPASTGLWYFYNPNVRTQGEAEFRRKWGNRKLEDNWRRANRNVVSASEPALAETEKNGTGQEGGGKALSNKSREFYLRDIPFTDSLRALSNQRIENALFDAGNIYMEKLKEPLLAAGSFEELLKRFPGGSYEPQALYYLYNLYLELSRNAEAVAYRNQLIRKHPENYYTRMLTDPEYLKHLEEEQYKPLRRYQEVYANYLNQRFGEVISASNSALREEKDTALIARYLYLKALSLARLNQRDSLRSTLNSLIARAPQSEAAGNARIMLDFMDNKFPEIKEKAEEKTAAEIYVYNLSEPHYAGILIPANAGMSQLVFNTINFNLDQFEKLNLNVEGENLGKDYQLILVKIFSSGTNALNYLNRLMRFPDLFRDVNAETSYFFVISSSNLATLKKDLVVDRYLRFYTANYPVK